MWHRFWHAWLHRLSLQPCRNDCAWIDGELHHWVYCEECGRIACSFVLRRRPDQERAHV